MKGFQGIGDKEIKKFPRANRQILLQGDEGRACLLIIGDL